MKRSGEERVSASSASVLSWRSVALGCAALAACTAGALFGLDRHFVLSQKIAQGVSVAGISIGGLSYEQVANLLTKKAPAPSFVRLVVNQNAAPMNLPASSVGLKYNTPEALYMAQDIGRKGSIVRRFTDRRRARETGVALPLHATYNKGALKWSLDNAVRNRFEVKPVNARIAVQSGELVKISGRDGIEIDVPRTLKNAVSFAVTKPTEYVELPVALKTARPHITLEDLQPIDSVLATYTTSYNPGKRSRTNNLRLAAKSINGSLLKPGDTFSYNDTVGPRVRETGYQDAIIFVKGKMEQGTGGGICQVSSTLYNSALLSGLKITQRSNHSMPVVYVPPGMDATVAYGSRDFKFRNSLGHTIYLQMAASGSRLTSTIYGAASDKKTVKIVRKVGRSVRHGTMTVVNPSLRPGRRIVSERGLNGVSVTCQRVIEENGEQKVDMVWSSRYRPHPTLVEVGPQPRPKPKSDPRTAAPAGAASAASAQLGRGFFRQAVTN
ncbi:MAG: VanW family protein [Armatimonadetes bacterium]|nr:VanW family protein [Armatimonadota bacterium]